ncbi:porin [Paraburkholderia sp.]|uniref:porin n=1 Tax=Paraburkholderia sp. TaxID=1926495 RepID=UPI002390F563|nr:porin [Paraburkholderia sp.]MDE1182600.1 porin [Paraburkholderia sp.]
MVKFGRLALTAVLAGNALVAHAQSSVTLYGVIDEYLSYKHSSSGASVTSLEDGGGIYSSRWGIRGVEDLGGGYAVKFQLESGFSAPSGQFTDTTRFFSRQAWVGLSSQYGEIRFGRQNSPVYTMGCYIDFACRGSGSIVNVFGLPVRYDNEISLLMNRIYGVAAELQVSLPQDPVVGNQPLVYQMGIDWKSSMFVVGYAGARAQPPNAAPIQKDVFYDNVFVNWIYGKGTVYLTFVRSNNNTASGGINNAGTILSNSGGFNAGTNPDLYHIYRIYQISADYQISPFMRVGAIIGKIDDSSGHDRGASEASVGLFYDLSKRTELMVMVQGLKNQANGGWRLAASGGVKGTFTVPTDVNGRTILGALAGISVKF